jgi:methylmalonyl-CoA/ethylmalonyl-CoA epimerase
MDRPLLVFHHVGVACRSLDREARPLLAMGYEAEAPDFEDPLQGVRGRFLVGQGPRMELLEPLPGSTTLDPFLDRGVKMYHHAYETPSVDAALAWYATSRARVVAPPKPAVAFGGRRVAFVALPTLMIIEIIETTCVPEQTQ